MKTTLFRKFTAPVLLAVRWFQIRSLEIQIDGMGEALELVRDPLTHGRIQIARHHARRELSRVRAEYCALLAPGVRRVWSTS